MQVLIAARVVSVSLSGQHTFSKDVVESIQLLAGLGVEGDAHCGVLVKHRYRVKQNPTQPNLCQIHLLQAELFKQLRGNGFDISPGEMGENITTSDIDLLALPAGSLLTIGESAVVEVTGLRSPCVQMNHFRKGLMAAVIERKAAGKVLNKAGIMAVVIAGGIVRAGDPIGVRLPGKPWRELICV